MNLPNKLTFLRILLIPVMVVIALIPYLNETKVILNISLANFINVIIFTIASITDALDGMLARKYNLITTFGKFADPLADKLLVMAAMVILMVQGVQAEVSIFPMWAAIVILGREFIVTGIRLVAVENGKVIAASNLGKLKTIATMVALIVLFFWETHIAVQYTGLVLVYIATFFTVISGFDYFFKNRKIILESV
ncbi:MAG: CDP-diacylglycerol--glycerol-3-phosphate 3-phosphatidyltransferase [bacterium]